MKQRTKTVECNTQKTDSSHKHANKKTMWNYNINILIFGGYFTTLHYEKLSYEWWIWKDLEGRNTATGPEFA
jgi:hypothetical protein